MGLLSLFFRDPISFLILAVFLLYSVIAHEIAHGWVAYLFGDNTAKHSGRLSFNPALHLDPMGTLALFIVGFGWARPVPVNFAALKNFRFGLICVSLAGCLTNILIATVALILLQSQIIRANTLLVTIFLTVARINIILGAFNLIPIPPLDGSKILMGFLPKNAQWQLAKLEPYGFFILILLLFTGLLNPVIIVVQKIILTLISPIVRLFS